MNGEVRYHEGEKHVYLCCSNCDAYLVDLFVTDDTPEIRTVFSASCPHCGDGSFPVAVDGLVNRAGVGFPKEDDPEDWVMSTQVAEDEETGGGFHFICVKDNDNARPCFNPG